VLSLPFMQLALATGVLVGLSAPAVGFFLVERRMSLVGDSIGHAAFAGVAAGVLLGVEPVWTALAAAVVGAASVEWLRSRGRAAGDQALAFLLYTGMAVGLVLIAAARSMNAGLFAYLFGSILTVTPRDLALEAVLAAAVLATLGLLYRPLLAVALDEEGARAAGLATARLNLLLVTLTAVTITASMRAVGLLLVAALMVLPVLAAGVLAKSVRSTIALAMALGVASAAAGLAASYRWNLAPGGAIILVAAAFYLAALGRRSRWASRLLGRRAGRPPGPAVTGAA
jgi:zinc transport system permease protein